MAQYDLDKDGMLKKRDFKNLANMVISHYRMRYFILPLLSANRFPSIFCRTFESNKEVIGKYVLARVLGQGTFGVVRLGIHRETGARCAIKIVSKGNVNDMNRVDVEIRAMLVLQHPHVARLEVCCGFGTCISCISSIVSRTSWKARSTFSSSWSFAEAAI